MSEGLLGPRLKPVLAVLLLGHLGAQPAHPDQLPAPNRDFIQVASRTAARDFWV